jgi:hypothetical protein
MSVPYLKVLDSMEEFVKVSHAFAKPVSTHDDISTNQKEKMKVSTVTQKYIETRSVPFTSHQDAREQVQWSMAVKMHRTEALLNRHGTSLYVRQLCWEKNKLELSKIKLETSRLELERSKLNLRSDEWTFCSGETELTVHH